MEQDKVFSLENHHQSGIDDPLTEILRTGARRLIEQAVETELELLMERTAHLKDARGRQRVVRNGHLPERQVQTGVGAVSVKVPRVHDRKASKEGRIRFTSRILPKYMRRTRSLDALIPWLYLKGVSTGDFSEALSALLGPDAPGLSQATVSRLKAAWQEYLMAGRPHGLEETQPEGQALSLRVGRRGVFQCADGPGRSMRAGTHWSDRGRAQGTFGH